MKIKNLGQIFVPQQHGIEYAKSPQAIVFDDFVRVYFSYCEKDGDKLISKVGFADYDFLFKLINMSLDVVEKAQLGTYDEHGIFPFSPFKDGDCIRALLSGWSRRRSVSVETAIGLAKSDDGGNYFCHDGKGPILTKNIDEPFLVVDGFMVKNEETYTMFYLFGTDWKQYDNNVAERTYKITFATSSDLVNWNRSSTQIIDDVIENECQALPTVIYDEGLWRMIFCYRNTIGFRTNSKDSYHLGYAYSKDLINWTRDDAQISMKLDEWNSDMQCYPNLFKLHGQCYMLSNGNLFGKNGFGLHEVSFEVN